MDNKQRKLINKNFRIVFEPKMRSVGAMFTRVRFGIGAGELENYVGHETALQAITGAWASKRDKYSFKHRKRGRLDFYTK